MDVKTLHIINGDSLAEKMQKLELSGDSVVWRELLCEGPTVFEVGSPEFLKLRKKFLREFYKISAEDYDEEFVVELKKLKKGSEYDEIVLWFEFDLFCHINMLAAIVYLVNHKVDVPMYLVCSQRLKGEDESKALTKLKLPQLQKHYENKIALNSDDIETAMLIWELYCSNNPMQLKQQITRTSNFEYLSSCIRAHIERFPNSKTGINTLEANVLKLIDQYQITSEQQLLGYAFEYQGYYGYSIPQMKRLLQKLKMFYMLKGERIVLTEAGNKALEGTHNFYRELKNEEFFGGAKMYEFLYESESHKLLKL